MVNPVTAYPRGNGPLWKVFWLYGVIPSNLLLGVILWMLWFQAALGAIITMLAVLLVYTGWIVVSVWQCADNVKTEHYYGVIARWLTVAWAANTLFFTAFLIIDLLT